MVALMLVTAAGRQDEIDEACRAVSSLCYEIYELHGMSQAWNSLRDTVQTTQNTYYYSRSFESPVFLSTYLALLMIQ